MPLKSTHLIIFHSKSTHYKIIPLFSTHLRIRLLSESLFGVKCFSDLTTQARNLRYREPQHKTQPQHTTTNMGRRRPTHQWLRSSLSMAKSAIDQDLGAAAPYGSEAGAGRLVWSRRCRFRRLKRWNRAREKIERCTGPWA